MLSKIQRSACEEHLLLHRRKSVLNRLPPPNHGIPTKFLIKAVFGGPALRDHPSPPKHVSVRRDAGLDPHRLPVILLGEVPPPFDAFFVL